MNPRRTAWLRRSSALALGAVAMLLLSGCIYLRLLALKRQLGDFDQHFTLHTSDGLHIGAREPVLRTGDMRWIGLAPETIRKTTAGEQWRVRWVKRLPSGLEDTGNFDLEIELEFTDDKLSGFHIPERYFDQISKPFLVDLLRSIGGGKVDQADRSVETRFQSDEEESTESWPTLQSVDDLLGLPTERRVRGRLTSLRYHYVPVAADSAKAGLFDITLAFDTASGELQRLQGRTPIGKVSFKFEASSPKGSGAPAS